jgi:membrane-associated phospholipid phosphatase
VHTRSTPGPAPLGTLLDGNERCGRRQRRTTATLAGSVTLAVFLGGLVPALGAQAASPEPAVIQWWQGAAVLGGIGLVSALDESVQRSMQQQRSPSSDQVAAFARHMGQPEVFATVPAAMFLTGVLARQPGLRRGGERVAGSLALAGALAVGGKFIVGRLRPRQVGEPYISRPFSGADAFPSGHTTMAFALATALADEIHRPWATVGLFTAATGTAWSRLNDNQHWLSDVVAGAVVGIASAQFIEGRWTLFHLRPPTVFSSHGQSGVGWVIPIGPIGGH